MDAPVFSVPWKQTPQELSFVKLRDVGLLLPTHWGMEWGGWRWLWSEVTCSGWLRTSCHSLPEVSPANGSKGLYLSPSGAPETECVGCARGKIPFFYTSSSPHRGKVRQRSQQWSCNSLAQNPRCPHCSSITSKLLPAEKDISHSSGPLALLNPRKSWGFFPAPLPCLICQPAAFLPLSCCCPKMSLYLSLFLAPRAFSTDRVDLALPMCSFLPHLFLTSF